MTAKTSAGLGQVQATSVSEITSRLLNSMRQSEHLNFGDWHLIQKMLTYAADAERQISEQKTRINKLEMLALKDELTGLPNRRGFERDLDRALANAGRYAERGLLALVDLDGFKTINDSFGYTAGDKVLKTVANLLADGTRSTDYVARVGGDEFVILFTRTEQHSARARAIAFKVLLNCLMVSHGSQEIRVKVRMGIQAYDKASNAQDLLLNANRALHRDTVTHA
ncbi:GGDEF domain-containing protein [bacterium AH-315-P15]|nr:GGDEF domain-containing protein [bacterium AH-315-P15]